MGLDASSARPPGTPCLIFLKSGTSHGVRVLLAYWQGELTYPADSNSRLGNLLGFLTLLRFSSSPSRRGFVSHHNAFGILPYSAFSLLRILNPLPGKCPSCRCFHARFFSEEKEAKMVARLQGFTPRAGPDVPVHRSELKRRGAPGILPLLRFHPRGRMLQAT